MRPENALQDESDSLKVDWLRNVSVESGIERASHVGIAAEGGYGYDGRPAQGGMMPKRVEKTETVETRHPEVAEDQIRLHPADRSQPFAAVLSYDNVRPERSNDLAKQFPRVRVIFED